MTYLRRAAQSRRLIWVAAVALLFAGVGQARADLYELTFTGATVNGSVLLDAIDLGGGTWLATSGTGSVTGAPQSGVLTLFPNPNPPNAVDSPSGFFLYNDLLYPNGHPVEFVDVDGPLFRLPNGVEVNLFNNGSPSNPQYLYFDNTGFNQTVGLSLSAVPEPSSLVLAGLGVVSLLGYRWRRKQ